MSKLTLEPPLDSDASVAARHLRVLLATERPDLGPALNSASLGSGGGGGDWPHVLRQYGEKAHYSSVISPIALTAAYRSYATLRS